MSLNRRIFLYFFGIFFLMMTIISFFQYQREKEFRAEQLHQQLTTYNLSIHRFLLEQKPDWDRLEEYVKLFPDSTLRVTIVDTMGVVTFDSFVKENTILENHLYRSEIAMSRKNHNGQAMRHSASIGSDYYYLAHHFPDGYVRSALPYNITLISMLKANTSFLYFMAFVLIIAMFAFYFIARNFTRSIDRLRTFTQRAEQGKVPDMEIEFSKDELGEISKNIVQLYKQLFDTKNEVLKEREKLITHLQISQEGLGIFSAEKKEILSNTNFIQYVNILSDVQSDNSEQIFTIPEFEDINKFINENLLFNLSNKKRLIIEKDSRVFAIQCVVFQDKSFEISINDISVQEHENQLKRHLTQNISHELKTPVSSILGYMESILENPDIDQDRQRFFVERSFLQAQRLSALLQDISTLNKIEEGKRVIEKESFNVSEVILDVLKDVNLEIEQKEFKVLKNFPDSMLIEGNRSLVYSIFRNLLDNSLTYAGTKLTIDIHCYREEEEFYYFSFSDNGVGVPDEHLNRLFERFYRIDKGRSRKMGGTGLGLAIVKNAVLFHNGTISAKNLSGGGLSYIFSLKKN